MNDITLGEIEAKFADLIWENEPLPSGELVKLAEALRSGFHKALLLPALAGFAAAALSGLLAVRLVRTLAQRGRFRNFAWYCWTAGLGAIIASILT